MECFVQCSEPQPIRREMRSTLTLGFSKKLSHLKAVALPMADNSRNPGQTTPKRSRNMPSSRRGKNPHWGGPGNVGHVLVWAAVFVVYGRNATGTNTPHGIRRQPQPVAQEIPQPIGRYFRDRKR